MSDIQSITILGSTGSIGESTLDVIARHNQYKVFALSANTSVEKLVQQCAKFNPRYAVMVDKTAAQQLKIRLASVASETQVLSSSSALLDIASHEEVDMVMAAIVGAAGLEPTLAAVQQGKKILLANKEALVMAGDLFMEALVNSDSVLLPIDSEHNAIFQCLPNDGFNKYRVNNTVVRKVILTASGGPFLNSELDQLENITPAQACQHPNWDMGKKISVDSATMMNKGLEFIEACYLFGLHPDQLEVLIHPQSIVHSMVEFCDGSVLSQMGTPDMRIPIAYGMAWPERIASGAAFLDLTQQEPLQFSKPDLQRFPCLRLGIEAARQGGTAPALLNAANEVAVEAFLQGSIGFMQIVTIIEEVLLEIPCEAALSLDIIKNADAQARSAAALLIEKVVQAGNLELD